LLLVAYLAAGVGALLALGQLHLEERRLGYLLCTAMTEPAYPGISSYFTRPEGEDALAWLGGRLGPHPSFEPLCQPCQEAGRKRPWGTPPAGPPLKHPELREYQGCGRDQLWELRPSDCKGETVLCRQSDGSYECLERRELACRGDTLLWSRCWGREHEEEETDCSRLGRTCGVPEGAGAACVQGPPPPPPPFEPERRRPKVEVDVSGTSQEARERTHLIESILERVIVTWRREQTRRGSAPSRHVSCRATIVHEGQRWDVDLVVRVDGVDQRFVVGNDDWRTVESHVESMTSTMLDAAAGTDVRRGR